MIFFPFSFLIFYDICTEKCGIKRKFAKKKRSEILKNSAKAQKITEIFNGSQEQNIELENAEK